MPQFQISPTDSLYYEYMPPEGAAGLTFVFFNALTGDVGMWSASIVPALQEAGHGALVYNMRGQAHSPFAPGLDLTDKLIAADATALLKSVAPLRPVLVGLSIGGLFAARAHLAGASAEGLVFINTLRKDGPRVRWLGEAMVRCVEVGGVELMRDLLTPLLFDEKWLAANRKDFLADGPYAPLDAASGTYKLLAGGPGADWGLPYEKLALPVLVLSGLQDHVFHEADVVAELAARMPNSTRLDVPDAGHLLPAEKPEAVTEALLHFAERIQAN
jgi:pimeloyl-ACP methyl ester carboxylesterase